MEKIKRNWYLILIAIATVVLGAIAVITAIKLYQLREKPMAPTAPESKPRAVSPQCTLEFSLAVTPTPTPTGSLTPTPTPTGTLTLTPTPTGSLTPTPTPTGTLTPTPTPPLGCWETCSGSNPCPSGLTCTDINGTNRCVNPSCSSESDCTCNKSCWEVCGHDNECPSGLSCRQIDAAKRCVNPSCEREQDCSCGGVTTTPRPTVTPTTYKAAVEIPVSGFSLPTLGAILGGIIFVVSSLLLIL